MIKIAITLAIIVSFIVAVTFFVFREQAPTGERYPSTLSQSPSPLKPATEIKSKAAGEDVEPPKPEETGEAVRKNIEIISYNLSELPGKVFLLAAFFALASICVLAFFLLFRQIDRLGELLDVAMRNFRSDVPKKSDSLNINVSLPGDLKVSLTPANETIVKNMIDRLERRINAIDSKVESLLDRGKNLVLEDQLPDLTTQYNNALKEQEKQPGLRKTGRKVYFTIQTIEEVRKGNPFASSSFNVELNENGKYFLLECPSTKEDLLFPDFDFEIDTRIVDELRMLKQVYEFSLKEGSSLFKVLAVGEPAKFIREHDALWKLSSKGRLLLEPKRN